MKKIKLLIPTLSALAVAPAIASCSNQKSDAENIIDAITAPTKITQEVKVDDIKKSFYKLSESDRQKEVLYDIFGICNKTTDQTLTFDKSLTTMWSEETVSFKTNITKCNMYIDSDYKITATFLGYVSFVFTKNVTASLYPSTKIDFKVNDYVMYTYDFTNANIELKNNGSLIYSPKIQSTMGFAKVKYNGGNDEFMYDLTTPDTSNYTPKNSHNWVQK